MKNLKQRIQNFLTQSKCDKEELFDILKEVWCDAYGYGSIDSNNLRYPSEEEFREMLLGEKNVVPEHTIYEEMLVEKLKSEKSCSVKMDRIDSFIQYARYKGLNPCGGAFSADMTHQYFYI